MIRLAQVEKTNDFVSQLNITENITPQKYFLSRPNCEISIVSTNSQPILDKLLQYKPLSKIYLLKNGLNPGNIKHILISNEQASEKHRKIIWGKDISKYNISWSGQYINYDNSIGSKLSIEDVKTKDGMNKQNKVDFALRSVELFESEKILVRKTGDSLICSLDSNNYYFDTLVHGIYKTDKSYNLKVLLAILNSKPATIFYRLLHDIKGKVFAKISLENLASFPLPKISPEMQNALTEKSELMLSLKQRLDEQSRKFQRSLIRRFDIAQIPTKLQNWNLLTYRDFVNELRRLKISFTLSQEAEWEEYFLSECAISSSLLSQINKTEKDIDGIVYKIYNITDEEIKILQAV